MWHHALTMVENNGRKLILITIKPSIHFQKAKQNEQTAECHKQLTEMKRHFVLEIFWSKFDVDDKFSL